MNQTPNQQQISISVESQIMNGEPQSGNKSRSRAKLQTHVEAKLQNEEDAHSDSEIRTHGRNAETYERDVHNDIEAERQIARPDTEPILSKYVRRHHPASQIIRDRNARHMTRSRFKSTTCLLSMKEPKTVKESLEDDN